MRHLRNVRTTLAAALFLIPAARALPASDEPLTAAMRSAALDAVVARLESTYALGAQRMRFAELSGLMTLTVEQADGTEIVLNRGQAS